MGSKRVQANLGKEECMPRKKFYRQRAHCNPLNDTSIDTPLTPDDVDWASHYPAFYARSDAPDAQPPPHVTIADIGCGFGGMTVAMAQRYPDTLVLGMEIREKVTEYVRQRIVALRNESDASGSSAFQNASVVRCNAMKCMANYFHQGQLEKLFFLFPDPHFKASNHRRRIINTHLLTEYAYFLKPGGIVYTITDVKELGLWMREKLEAHPLFEPLTDAQLAGDPAAALLDSATEEGKKVARNHGSTWKACYRRREFPCQMAALHEPQDQGAEAD